MWQYDLDGNLTQDGRYKYVWAGENRLIEAATRKDLGANTLDYDAGDRKLTFKYDYLGRRVRKTAWTYNGSGWDEDSDLLFVYDGWNVVMVLDANDGNAILRKYTWGLDLSGTLRGAGGIGGLLAVEETATTGSPSYWYFYDANGNVGQVIAAADSSIAARYRYDPYGNIVGPDDDNDGDWRDDAGPYAEANPYRFSTKWLDDELIHDTTWVQSAFSATGMYYYGYRYYSPQVGRWINRDPIEEKGGIGVYVFVANNPTTRYDMFGLEFTVLDPGIPMPPIPMENPPPGDTDDPPKTGGETVLSALIAEMKVSDCDRCSPNDSTDSSSMLEAIQLYVEVHVWWSEGNRDHEYDHVGSFKSMHDSIGCSMERFEGLGCMPTVAAECYLGLFAMYVKLHYYESLLEIRDYDCAAYGLLMPPSNGAYENPCDQKIAAQSVVEIQRLFVGSKEAECASKL